MNLSQRLRLVSLDKQEWQRLYYRNQQSYIRQRLSAIRYLSEGKSRATVAILVGCADLTLAEWMKKKREKLNGLLGVDAVSGEEFLRLSNVSRSEDLALYFGELCQDCLAQNIKKLTIILDNNSTHKNKLRRHLRSELTITEIEDKITVEFVYLPPYSPNFNLAEYLIHLLRLRLLHHLPIGTTIEQVRMRIKSLFENQQLQTSTQIENTIQHIYELIL